MKFLLVPLTHLVPPEQQRGGQKSYDEKVASIIEDVTRRGYVPSWATNHVDVARLTHVAELPVCPLCGGILNNLEVTPRVMACSVCEHVETVL